MIKITVPLPALAEQQRVVTKVDELIGLCDRLEAGLATVGHTRGRLLEAILHEALAEAA
jgi:type I restriction enzyme S subunit